MEAMMNFELFVEANNYTIYCDMDGVLCDFDKAVAALGHGTVNQLKASGQVNLWRVINRAGEEFWSEMPWLPDGRKLWKFISDSPVKIASTPSRSNASKSGKKKWCKDNLGNIELILTSKKEEHADPNSILIDDREENIMKWKKEGGIGILHKSADSTIKQLEQIFSDSE